MRARAGVAAAVAAAVLATAAAGCSGPGPADLFLVTRSGSIAGARLTLRITDDGGAFCNGGKVRHEITSAQLIDARALRRTLDGDGDKDPGLASRHLDLPPGPTTTLSYRVRSENGVVAFSDTSAHQPAAFYQLAQLTHEVAQQACGLPR